MRMPRVGVGRQRRAADCEVPKGPPLHTFSSSREKEDLPTTYHSLKGSLWWSQGPFSQLQFLTGFTPTPLGTPCPKQCDSTLKIPVFVYKVESVRIQRVAGE